MDKRTLGKDGPAVSSIGLGCMGMSDAYGPADEAESLATLDRALGRGVTLFDTADFYGTGHNELLLGRAFAGRRHEVFLSVKFGALRDPAGGWAGFDGRPAAVGNALAHSLRRLRTDYVDLYVPARLDPQVPIEDTVGAVARWVEKGFVRHIGLSELSAATIRRAAKVHPIRSLQIEYSLMSRGIEAEVLPACRELGIATVAYGTLARGLLAGRIRDAAAMSAQDGRRHYPRYQGENLARNLALVEKLRAIAERRGATPTQLAIAWVLAKGSDMIPIVGARKVAQLDEMLGAADVQLDDEAVREIEAAVPHEEVAGARYPEHSMRSLDGNR